MSSSFPNTDFQTDVFVCMVGSLTGTSTLVKVDLGVMATMVSLQNPLLSSSIIVSSLDAVGIFYALLTEYFILRVALL